MDWINGLFTVHSAIQTVVVLSLICYVGLILGKIHVKGISLGVAFVFFIGIIAGHWGLDIDPTVLQYAEAFGLVLFVYTLGLHVGPNFFGSLRKEGISLNLWGFAVIAVGTILALVLSEVTNVPMQTRQPLEQPSKHSKTSVFPRVVQHLAVPWPILWVF